jgi:hypothetical protein
MNIFYASAQKFQTSESVLTGKQIKEIANISPGNPLFQDNFGNGPDSPIGDGVAVNIAESVKHFYAPPPATMYRGCQ